MSNFYRNREAARRRHDAWAVAVGLVIVACVCLAALAWHVLAAGG